MSDEFKGANFVAKFFITKEHVERSLLTENKKEMFRNIVKMAVERVRNIVKMAVERVCIDLTETMTIRGEDGSRDISEEEYDKALEYGIKITIIGEIKE